MAVPSQAAPQSRRRFLQTAGFAILSARSSLRAAAAGASQRDRRPNVVLVITDDQGYGDLSCHGNQVLRTPNIDRLYAQSIRLTDFHVSPTCSPTRASLMTGRYCNRTGVWHTVMGRSLLRRDEVTMGEVFSNSGYRTAIFGKWHLGDNYPFRPQDRGFQDVLVHRGGGVGQTPDFWGNDYFDDTYLHNGRLEKVNGYCTDVWFERAMDFIEANKQEPFFVYLATNAPHAPYNVAEEYAGLYRDKGVPNANFYGMIANIDDNMGRLVAKLASLGIEDNTILIFMTDNGTTAGFANGKGFNAGMRGVKGSEYDGGHRVPCFMRWPDMGIIGGKDIGALAAHIDLLPTLAELCRLRMPAGVKFDGLSLAGLLTGQKTDWPDRVVITDSQRIEHPQMWRKCAVMTERWRLVNCTELYDIKADPGQTTNVATQHSDAVERLRKAYEAWWTDVSQRFGEYCEIVLGSEKENPVRLTCHDWHGEPTSEQAVVREGRAINGFWAVDVAHASRYEIALRRWPAEVDTPITAAIAGGEAINATKARLKIGDIDLTEAVEHDAKAVTFSVRLKKGKTQLQTWFMDDAGASRGAYYVYVKRL